MTIPVDVINALNQVQASHDAVDVALSEAAAATNALAVAQQSEAEASNAAKAAATKLTADTDALIDLINRTYRPATS